MNGRLLLAAALAFVVGVVAFSFIAFDSAAPTANLLEVQGDCDLSRSPCTAKDQAGHAFYISLSPRPVPLLKEVSIAVLVKGLENIRTAQLSIEGLNMYMGVQIIPLTLQDGHPSESSHPSNKTSQHKLTGVLQLPICTSRKMDWQATLVVQTSTQKYTAAYPFTTVAP